MLIFTEYWLCWLSRVSWTIYCEIFSFRFPVVAGIQRQFFPPTVLAWPSLGLRRLEHKRCHQRKTPGHAVGAWPVLPPIQTGEQTWHYYSQCHDSSVSRRIHLVLAEVRYQDAWLMITLMPCGLIFPAVSIRRSRLQRQGGKQHILLKVVSFRYLHVLFSINVNLVCSYCCNMHIVCVLDRPDCASCG